MPLNTMTLLQARVLEIVFCDLQLNQTAQRMHVVVAQEMNQYRDFTLLQRSMLGREGHVNKYLTLLMNPAFKYRNLSCRNSPRRKAQISHWVTNLQIKEVFPLA